MNKKLLSLLLSALALGALSARAQTVPAAAAPAAPSSTWTLTPSVASQYMFRGVRLGGPSFQPTLEYAEGPFTAGLWANFPFSNKVPGQSAPEFDLYASYKIEAVKDTLVWQPGITVYAYPNANKNNGFYKSSIEPNLALNYSVAGWTLTSKAYYDIVLKGPTLEFTAFYALPLKDAGTELDFTATVGTYKWNSAFENSTPDTKNYGNYFLVGVAAPFQLTKDSKLTVGYAYTKGSDNFVKTGSLPKFENTSAVGRGVVTVSYAITF